MRRLLGGYSSHPRIAEDRDIAAFGDFDDQGLRLAEDVEILVQPEPQLAGMNAHGAVLKGAVVRRLTQNCLADLLLGQLVGATMKGALRDVEEEITQAGRFMKSGTGGDPLDQLPPLITHQVVLTAISLQSGSHIQKPRRNGGYAARSLRCFRGADQTC